MNIVSYLNSISNNKNEDKLFLDRFEERVYLPYREAADILENCHSLTENTESNAFIQNIYFDTDDRAMPLGNATRIRKYLKNPNEEITINGENIIDIG